MMQLYMYYILRIMLAIQKIKLLNFETNFLRQFTNFSSRFSDSYGLSFSLISIKKLFCNTKFFATFDSWCNDPIIYNYFIYFSNFSSIYFRDSYCKRLLYCDNSQFVITQQNKNVYASIAKIKYPRKNVANQIANAVCFQFLYNESKLQV